MESDKYRLIPLWGCDVHNTSKEIKSHFDGEHQIPVPICPYLLLLGILPLLLAILTVLGNILVIAAILTDKKLKRKLTSILIFNLALADLLVGLIAMPLAMALIITNGKWIFGRGLCRVWISFDVICSTASIVTLCVISVDRFIGVMYPLRYQRLITKRRLIFSSICVWLFSTSVLLGTINYSRKRKSWFTECTVGDELRYVTSSSICSFFLPLVVILVVYYRIYQVTKRREASLIRNAEYAISVSRVLSKDRKTERRKALIAMINENETASKFTSRWTGRNRTSTAMQSKRSPRGSGSPRIEPDSNSSGEGDEAMGKAFADSNPVAEESGKKMSLMPEDVPELRIHYGGGHSETASCKRRRFFQKHKKSAKTLGLVVGAFLMCWFPFFTLYLIDNACGSCIPSAVLTFFSWLGYSNSAINPFIYAVLVPAFREAFIRLIRTHICPCSGCLLRENSHETGKIVTTRENRSLSTRSRMTTRNLSTRITTDNNQNNGSKLIRVSPPPAIIVLESENSESSSSSETKEPNNLLPSLISWKRLSVKFPAKPRINWTTSQVPKSKSISSSRRASDFELTQACARFENAKLNHAFNQGRVCEELEFPLDEIFSNNGYPFTNIELNAVLIGEKATEV